MSPSEFVKKLTDLYISKQGIFIVHKNAEDFVPQNATDLQKSIFLFYIIQIDYAMKGSILYKGATELWQDKSDFFDTEYITHITEDNLKSILQKYLKPRYINEAILRYKKNTQVLLDNFAGKPLKIFQEKSAKEVMTNLRKFRGFGPKIGTLFFRTIVNTFKLDYTDMEDILQPVDIHDVRIAYLLGYTDTDEMSEKNIFRVKNIWNQACKDADIDWKIFDRALWILGSEGKLKSRNDIDKFIEI